MASISHRFTFQLTQVLCILCNKACVKQHTFCSDLTIGVQMLVFLYFISLKAKKKSGKKEGLEDYLTSKEL